MTRPALRIESLTREVLDGVVDGSAEGRRRVDVGLVMWCRDERPLRGLAGLLDWRAHGKISSWARSQWCCGSADEFLLTPGGHRAPMHRLVLHGVGRSTDLNFRSAAARARRACEVIAALKPTSVLVAVPGVALPRDVLETLVSGLAVGADQRPGVPWWVVVEEREANRVRRLLDGPPRAAES